MPATATTSSSVTEKGGKKTKNTGGSKAEGTKDNNLKGKARVSTFKFQLTILEQMLTAFITGR